MNMISVSIFLFAGFVSLTHLLQEEGQYTHTGTHKCCLVLHRVIASQSLCNYAEKNTKTFDNVDTLAHHYFESVTWMFMSETELLISKVFPN